MIALLCLVLAGDPATVSVGADTIVSAAREYVARRLDGGGDAIEADVRNVPEAFRLSGTSFQMSATAADLPAEGGNVTIKLEIVSSVGERRTTYVALHVRRFSTVAVATRMVDRQEGALERAVRFDRCETTGIRGELVRTTADLAGKRARRVLKGGTILTQSMLDAVPDIQPNRPVTIRVRSGGVVLCVEGVSREAGRHGETIGVVRRGSHDLLHATVVDSATVDVRIP
jgi:flagella basal body P-ring formation protein FlgA